MNASPAEIITALLVSLGLAVRPPGTASTWPITDSSMPDDGQDNWITVYDTGGEVDGRIFRTGEQVIHPTFQVRIRSVKALDAYKKGWAIQDAITRQSKGVTVAIRGDDYTIRNITITNPLMRIGQEEKNRRQLYTLNAKMTLGG